MIAPASSTGARRPARISSWRRATEIAGKTRASRIDDCHRQLLERSGTGHGLYLTVTRGSEEIVVICSRPFIGLVEQIFAGERLLCLIEHRPP